MQSPRPPRGGPASADRLGLAALLRDAQRLDDGRGRFATFVAMLQPGPIEGLLSRIWSQNAPGDRLAVLNLHRHKRGTYITAEEPGVRRLTLQNATEGDHAVRRMVRSGKQGLHRHGNLPREIGRASGSEW